jgi:hypothetical protein
MAVLILGCACAAFSQTGGTKLGPRTLTPPPAATLLPSRLSVAELAKQADVIAIGKVTEFRSEWNAGHTRVFPQAVFAASEYLKAAQTPPAFGITYAESGPEIVRYQKDEEVLVFLRKNIDGQLETLAGSQGRYVVTKDVRTARKMVSAYTTLEAMKAEITAAVRNAPPR